LASIGVKMDEEERSQILPCFLLDSWDFLVMAIGITSCWQHKHDDEENDELGSKQCCH